MTDYTKDRFKKLAGLLTERALTEQHSPKLHPYVEEDPGLLVGTVLEQGDKFGRAWKEFNMSVRTSAHDAVEDDSDEALQHLQAQLVKWIKKYPEFAFLFRDVFE